MSDRDLDNSRVSYLKKLDKYMEAGISVYSLKTNDSYEQFKPIKKQSGNILEDLKRETKFKNKLIKMKKKKKLLTNFNQTAKEEYKNFLILNREKKFKSYFHETESKSKKYCTQGSHKEIEEIKTVMFVNPIENKDICINNKDRNSGSKSSQRGKKFIKEDMFITNLDKTTKLISDQHKREYLINVEEKIHNTNKEKNSIESNFKNTIGYNSFENFKNIENKNSNEVIEKYINYNKDIYKNRDSQIINYLNKVDVIEKNKNSLSKKSLELSKNLLDNSIEINQSSLLPKESLEQNNDSNIFKNDEGKIIICNNNYNLFENNNIISNLNFYPICKKFYKNVKKINDNYSKNKNLNIIKSPTYDPDFHLLYPERIQQEKNTSMNFNKNPGLIKRANLRFSCIDFNTILINKSENEFNKFNEEYKNNQIDFNTLNNSIKLPELKNSLNFHRKNYSQIPIKVNFMESFNKFTNSRSKEILINKNIIFNSATDLRSKLSKVKSMEKSELFKRSYNKVNLMKEKNYSIYNKHNNKNSIKFKNNTDGYLFRDNNLYDRIKNNNFYNNLENNNNNFYPSNYQNLNNNNFCNHDYNNIYDFNNGTYDNNETNQIDEDDNNFNSENYNNIMINENFNYNNIENLTSNEKSYHNDITNEEKKKETSDSNSHKKFNIIKNTNEFYSYPDIDRRFDENNNFSIFSKIKNVKMNLKRNLINENLFKDSLKSMRLENSNRNSSQTNNPQIEAGGVSLPKTTKKYSKGYHPINNIIYNEEKGPFLIDLYNRKKK